MMFGIKTYFSNMISYFIDSLWEDDLMQFKQAKNVLKTEKKPKEIKDIHSQSIESHSKMATNIVHFPRKTNMGHCKRGHSIG